MILGPSVGNTFKINNTYHYNIILKYKNKDVLYDIFEKIIEHYKTNIKIKIDIDFNPSQIL